MAAVYFVLRPEDRGWFDEGVFGEVTVLAGLFNLLPDYVSLLETRYVIRRMRKTNALGIGGWLVLDSALTTGIFCLGVVVGLFVGILAGILLFPPETPLWEMVVVASGPSAYGQARAAVVGGSGALEPGRSGPSADGAAGHQV